MSGCIIHEAAPAFGCKACDARRGSGDAKPCICGPDVQEEACPQHGRDLGEAVALYRETQRALFDLQEEMHRLRSEAARPETWPKPEPFAGNPMLWPCRCGRQQGLCQCYLAGCDDGARHAQPRTADARPVAGWSERYDLLRGEAKGLRDYISLLETNIIKARDLLLCRERATHEGENAEEARVASRGGPQQGDPATHQQARPPVVAGAGEEGAVASVPNACAASEWSADR